MIPCILFGVVGAIFLLLLPGFYLYSPTSRSTKIVVTALVLKTLKPYFPDGLRSSSIHVFTFLWPARDTYWSTAALLAVAVIFLYTQQQRRRYRRINKLKKKFGFNNDPVSWKDMTVEQAQEIECNMAEWEFPRLFQFAWISDFLRVCAALDSYCL